MYRDQVVRQEGDVDSGGDGGDDDEEGDDDGDWDERRMFIGTGLPHQNGRGTMVGGDIGVGVASGVGEEMDPPRPPHPCLFRFLAGLFLPEGYPSSVAPEYASYQLFDTIQQITFFVNTVIAAQAVMKFHGVGDASRTPVQATALEFERDLFAMTISFSVLVPTMVAQYKSRPARYRMASEVLNAVGLFLEIIAAIATHMAALVYSGPVVCRVGSAMGGATRAKILQHFARAGNNGDIKLKEGNQDKGGKIIGLGLGIGLLYWMGTDESSSALWRSAIVFAALTVVHLIGNAFAVRQLKFPDEDANETESSETEDGNKENTDEETGLSGCSPCIFLRSMFLPPKYPRSLAESYTRYRAWSLLEVGTRYPKRVVVSLAFWAHIYGVGDRDRTPRQAVMLNIFMTSVDTVISLIFGLPSIKHAFDYSEAAWLYRSGLAAIVSQTIRLAAALAPQGWFYPLIILSLGTQAFANVTGSVVRANIDRDWPQTADVQLVDISVANANQDLSVAIVTALACVGYLKWLVRSADDDGPDSGIDQKAGFESHHVLPVLLIVFGALQLVSGVSILGCYRNMPHSSPSHFSSQHSHSNSNVAKEIKITESKTATSKKNVIEEEVELIALRK